MTPNPARRNTVDLDGTALLAAAYRPLFALAATVREEDGWLATRLPGWTFRDLLFHLAGDAQRALVAFGTRSERSADTDAISYWSHRGAPEGRVLASACPRWPHPPPDHRAVHPVGPADGSCSPG
jgi:Mycothiol maleylpyruvate isomerase N-terminal domain